MNPMIRLMVLVAAALVCSPAFGVIVAGGDGTGNTAADGNFPAGWEYVGICGNGSAVYLGDGWALTAYHVSPKASVNFGGLDYAVESSVRLHDPYNPTAVTDLTLMKLVTSPDLPTLNIAATPAAAGDPITMIGAGRNRAASFTWYDTDPDPWSETAEDILHTADAYKYADGRTLRWGTNVVTSQVEGMGDYGYLIGFWATFDDNVGPNEAMAAPGDSGGGVFDASGTLLGVMTNIRLLEGQPSETVAYGNATFMIDLSNYRDEILAVTGIPEPATLTTLLAASALVALRRRRA